MKFLLTNKALNGEKVAALPFELNIKNIGIYNLLIDELEEFKNLNTHYEISEGYIRDLNKNINDIQGQEESAVLEISNSWPLPDNITGSFSCLLIDKSTFEVIICNDLIGPYPLYYLSTENEFFISNSIILLGAVSKCGFDDAGIIQRCMGPDFSNVGSRTILKNCKRLLPGEHISFDSSGKIFQTKYDNSLYQQISGPSQDHSLHKGFLKAYQKELSYCLNYSKNVNIALSGGIDSRITFGLIPEDKKIKCFTFGENENYETKIAARLAKKKDAVFKNFSQPELYFPDVEILKKYTLKSEAVYYCSWLEILENATPEPRTPFLLGDLTTALTGRTIEKFSSKKFRQENFIKYYFLKKDYQFEENTKETFEIWKKSKVSTLDRWYTESRLSQFNLNSSRAELVAALHENIQELFERIEKHNLPYIELCDELFSWFTHNRIQVAKQILICNTNYNCYSPSMSIQILRKASNIHPNLRLNFRFIKKLYEESEELRKLFRIPTSQAPLIPQNFPDLIKFPIWGLRSKIDQYLIRRLMKHKDISKRYRLFKSTSWPEIYQNPRMEQNIKDYFKNNYLGEKYFRSLINQSVKRKNLEQWPFANLEVINASSLNIELGLINEYSRQL